MDHDIIIIGAGPAGLALACALAETPLRVLVVERQEEPALAEPAFDGREIALTHRSARILGELAIWERLPAADISALRDAKILNGPAHTGLRISHSDGRAGQLGYLVSNHLIRRAAYDCARAAPRITLRAGTRCTAIQTDGHSARLTLATGEQVSAPLAIAADSRFSESRRAMGIPASMHDFGRTMLVCCMSHAVGHDHVAWEWFDYGQTLALLPMNGSRSSVVITLPHREIEALLAMDEEAFGREAERRFHGRLGAMRLESTRHAYPLVAVYPRRFVANRFAVVGDAAVGMHPVTAHGYNLGLVGVELLAAGIRSQLGRGADIGAASMLAAYERQLRRATAPLYAATRVVIGLYTKESLPARVLRGAVLRVANRLPPFRRALAAALTDRG